MVTSKTFERLMTISEQIAIKAGTDPAVAKNVLEAARDDIISRRRQPAPPAPEGGISIRAAGKKYKIPFQTISQWVQRGVIKPLLRTNNELYISEKTIAEIAVKYKQSHGRGNRELFNELKSKQTPITP